jgi:hypothetical protein
VTSPDHRRRRILAIAPLLLLAACSSSAGSVDGPPATPDRDPNQGPLPSLVGGVELTAVDPATVLVGQGLAFGQPLPSEDAAAQVFTVDPEVTAATARRVHSLLDGRLVGQVVVLQLDGAELFDADGLDAFVRAAVASFGGGEEAELELAGRPTYHASGDDQTAVGFVEGDLLVVMTGPVDHDARVVVERQLEAMAAGEPGSLEPRTPMVPLAIQAAYVPVAALEFQVIPPPEEELPPVPPSLAGATGLDGRYGVVAGERRTTIWVFTLDPATYPYAEALDPALGDLASARAGGAPSRTAEVVDRVVHRADGADEVLSTRVFRHQGLVILVEGFDPAQLDAVVSAWLTALAAAG